MVRHHFRKTIKNETGIQEALKAIAKGESLRQAASEFKVPRSSVSDRLRGVPPSVGHPTVLSRNEESSIALAIEYCGKNGWP